MPNADALRLYVYVRLSSRPLTVEIDFPGRQRELAQRYRNSIRDVKTLPPSRQTADSVAFELPDSAKYIDTSQSLQSLVVHFNTKEDAAGWADAICLPLKGHERRVIVKQYWNETELMELKRKLPELKKPPPPPPPPPDRAGTPPGEARRSRKS